MSEELRIFKKSNSPYWYIRGTIHGKEVYETTGIPHLDLAKPSKLVRDYRNKRVDELRGKYIYGKTYAATFADAALNYLKAGGSPRFLDRLIHEIGETQLTNIDQQFLDEMANKLFGHCKPETINRQFWTPFIAVWTYNTKGQNSLCPLVNWQRPKRKKSTSRSRKPVSYDEAIRFINELSYPAAKVMFFLFWSGCRPLEAFELKAQNLHPEIDWISLDETKTDIPRGIPIHRCLKPMLGYLSKFELPVFLNSMGRPYPSGRKLSKTGRVINNSGGQMATPINTAREKTGLNITPYIARHTVSTNLIWPCGVGEMIKDEILGHASKNEMSRHYTHLPRKALIEAVNKLPYPEGLREDLYVPCKIRAAHLKTYGEVYSKPTLTKT